MHNCEHEEDFGWIKHFMETTKSFVEQVEEYMKVNVGFKEFKEDFISERKLNKTILWGIFGSVIVMIITTWVNIAVQLITKKP